MVGHLSENYLKKLGREKEGEGRRRRGRGEEREVGRLGFGREGREWGVGSGKFGRVQREWEKRRWGEMEKKKRRVK